MENPVQVKNGQRWEFAPQIAGHQSARITGVTTAEKKISFYELERIVL